MKRLFLTEYKFVFIGFDHSITILLYLLFTGISRVEFDEIIPLKLYFQEDHLSNIRASPTTITEDFCGKF